MTQTSFINCGKLLPESEKNCLNPEILNVLNACENHPCIEFVELRKDEHNHTLIVIDVNDGTFEVPNQVGIKRNERLALRFQPEEIYQWAVLALREDFPVTIHQNQTVSGQPRDLCIYAQPWATVERSWTPESFLVRVFWWLRATADGTIHPDDQPLEELFFISPYHFVLPNDIFSDDGQTQHEISFSLVPKAEGKTQFLIGGYASNNEKNHGPTCLPIFVPLEPIANGRIEDCPVNLAQLQERVQGRGSDLLDRLKEGVKSYIGSGKEIVPSSSQLVLIFTVTPRERNNEIERFDLHGFLLESHIGELGEALGVAHKALTEANTWYSETTIGDTQPESTAWRSISVAPVSVSQFPSRSQIHSYSGHQAKNNDLQGILAGTGALGSALAQIWERECWGHWHYVDEDVIKPHNLTRHIGAQEVIGQPKSLVVDWMNRNIHAPQNPDSPQSSRHFICSVLSEDEALQEVISRKDLIIDATTTLYVPRELARKDCPRVASVFFTPSGLASVLLLEDKARTIRANHLEAQYYRAMLESDWGLDHLEKNLGSMWVGAGCREATVALPYELVMTHAANLARRVRHAVPDDQAIIGVWTLNEDTGSISADLIEPASPCQMQMGDWQVIWDEDIEEKLNDLRTQCLPYETGGILLGIVDQKDKTITVVTASEAPEGSSGSASSFSRSSAEEVRENANKRTGGIVNYIGEWHSHPQGCSAMPSHADIYQLAYIGNTMFTEGKPTLMIIVSDGQIGFSVLGLGGNDESIIYINMSKQSNQ